MLLNKESTYGPTTVKVLQRGSNMFLFTWLPTSNVLYKFDVFFCFLMFPNVS